MYYTGTGQWMEEDPIQFDAGDPNLRRDVGNDPTNLTDPSGLQPLPDERDPRWNRPPYNYGPIKLEISGFFLGPRKTTPVPASVKLDTPEKAMIAVFHNAVDNLTDAEFSKIINEVTIGNDSTLSAQGERRPLEKITARGGDALRSAFISITFSGGAAAITLPPELSSTRKTMIVSKEPLKPTDGKRVTNYEQFILLGHELQHAIQIERSKGAFVSQYLNSYTHNRVNRFMPEDEAYRSIPAEIEAYAFEAALQQVLRTKASRDEFERVCNKYSDKDALALITTDKDAADLATRFRSAFQEQKAKLTDEANKRGRGKRP
jgi:hypothetical protein